MIANITDTITTLSKYWELLFPVCPLPTPRQWAVWLINHDEITVRKALGRLSQKHDLERKSFVDLPKFVSGICIRIDQERAAEAAEAPAKMIMPEPQESDNRWNK
jgi:hypothetical protein